MVDEKPDFKVKWHGENIECPPSSGNIRKILCKGKIVEADVNIIRSCMVYFGPIPDGPSDEILMCNHAEAAVMRKVIQLLKIGEIECTCEELGKIATALRMLCVHPYNVAEGEAHVEISIVPHWPITSRPEDITVYVKDFKSRENREFLVEMSGHFEELLKNHHDDTLYVPSATDGTLRWFVDTIHQREIIVSTHMEMMGSHFEEYCLCLQIFRFRQPSSKLTRTPSSERVRPPSTEQSTSQSRQQVSAIIHQEETSLPLVDECSTKAGTQDKAGPSSAKKDLSAKSADQSRESAGSSLESAGSSLESAGPPPKSHRPSPKGASPSPKKD